LTKLRDGLDGVVPRMDLPDPLKLLHNIAEIRQQVIADV
jgi:hypothetical protein